MCLLRKAQDDTGFSEKENPTKCLELILKRIYSRADGGKYEQMKKD
jgi:hypothetical protein